MHTPITTTAIPEANPIRGLHFTYLAPPVVDRIVTADEAKQSALRLANAAVSNGPRPVIHRPASPTDDDVTVLAFIEQHREPIVEERPRTVHPDAKVPGVQVPKGFVAGTPIEDLALLVAGQFGLFHNAEKGDLAKAAVSLLNPSAKPKTPLPSPLAGPSGDRERLLLAASLLLHEVAGIDADQAAATPPLMTTP